MKLLNITNLVCRLFYNRVDIGIFDVYVKTDYVAHDAAQKNHTDTRNRVGLDSITYRVTKVMIKTTLPW